MKRRALAKPTLWEAACADLCMAALACALLAALPAAAQSGGGCEKDTECKGSRICVNRACIDPPPVVACARDVDCPGDDVCVERQCAAPPAAGPGAAKSPAGKKKAAAAPAPAPAPAPPPAPIEPPTVLILASPPPAVPPAGTPAPAHVAAPPPASTTASPAPAGAPSAPPTIRRVDEAGFSPSWLYSTGVQGGFHSWNCTAGTSRCLASKEAPSGTTQSEGDFGFSLSAEGGLRLSDHLGLLAVGHASWTLMAAPAATLLNANPSSNNGVMAGVGLGLRLDHVGPLTGHFTLGATGTFGSILSGNGNTASISLSGGAVAFSYSQPINGALGLDVRVGWHFLSNDFSLLVLGAGISFGN